MDGLDSSTIGFIISKLVDFDVGTVWIYIQLMLYIYLSSFCDFKNNRHT